MEEMDAEAKTVEAAYDTRSSYYTFFIGRKKRDNLQNCLIHCFERLLCNHYKVYIYAYAYEKNLYLSVLQNMKLLLTLGRTYRAAF